MKATKQELLRAKNGKIHFEEKVEPTEELLSKYTRIRKLQDVIVVGEGRYEPSYEELYLHLDIKGTVIVPCDITWDDVEVPFHLEEDVTYSFIKKDDPDIIYVDVPRIDTLPLEMHLIYYEIPMKVVKPGKIVYPKGDGWEVISEEEYDNSKRASIDPRLAKLKDYHPKD